MSKTLSRRETRQALSEMPIESVLMVNKTELTTKQKNFAKAVALGETGAGAYRLAYNTKAKPKHQGNKASELKADERIQREIQAYKLANEAAAYRTASQLRDLVIHSLTQVLIDPDTNPAQRIQAAKVLGTVTEVAAFTELKQVTNITGSDVIKAKIMAELNTLMMGNGSTDIEDVDAVSLLDELAAEDIPDTSEGTVGAPPQNENGSTPGHEHITPHKQSTSESTPIDFPDS